MKRYKVLKYVFLSITILFNAFIIVQASLPGSFSSVQSNFLSNIFAFLINSNVSTSVNTVELNNIYFQDNIESLDIVYGTTQRLTVYYEPSDASNLGLTYSLSDNDNFNVIQSGNYFYIESYTESESSTLTITSTYNSSISKSIILNGTPLNKPSDYSFEIENNELEVGMSSNINITYLDYDDQLTAIRYYDEYLLDFESSNKDVAYVDEYNVVHALSEGETYIYEVDNPDNKLLLSVNSNGEELVYPQQLIINGDFNVGIYDLDYGLYNQLEVEFIGDQPTDTSVTYIVSDPLYVKISKDGKMYGYKKQGSVNVRAISNMDNNVYYDFVVNINEVVPTSMTLNTSSLNSLGGVSLNNTFTITASFEPSNTTNLEIGVLNYESNFDLIMQGRQISLLATSLGEVTLTIYSVSNPSLTQELTVTVTEAQAINEDNYSDFHSFIRKFIGHFFLFGIDAILLYLTIFFFFKDIDKVNKEKYLLIILGITLLIGLVVAGSTEIIQLFVEDRTGSFSDVLIDFSGVIVFALITYAVIHLIRYIIKKKKQKKEDNKT